MLQAIGKRTLKPLNDRDIVSPSPAAVMCVSSASSALSASQRAVLDFVLSHAKGDERPYLSVDILGVKLDGLLDSGAS